MGVMGTRYLGSYGDTILNSRVMGSYGRVMGTRYLTELWESYGDTILNSRVMGSYGRGELWGHDT